MFNKLLHQELYRVCKKTGNTYVTIFEEDNIIIPWKLLSVGNYIKYQKSYQRGNTPPVIVEDLIFRECVLDPTILNSLDILKAGIISTVVMNIWMLSGPQTIDSFNNDLNNARGIIYSDEFSIIHELVQVIATAFPYKPEEIYAMDYETFLIRLTQAEYKLIKSGILQEPIILQTKDTQQKVKPKVDAKKIWDERQEQQKVKREQPKANTVKNTPKNEDFSTISKEKWYDKSPILEVDKPSHGINMDKENYNLMSYSTNGSERLDMPSTQRQLIKDANVIYADVIKELNKKKQEKNKS